MTHRRTAAIGGAVALLVLGGCAAVAPRGMAPPDGAHALGLEFGRSRADVERALVDAGIAARPAAGDPDALVAARCPDAPVDAPCRLAFGPGGLFAADVEAPVDEAPKLVAAAERGLGAPARRASGTTAVGADAVLAAWDRPGWTVAVSRRATPGGAGAIAALSVEWDDAAPPVVAGVPLARARAAVEAALARAGAMLASRDADTTTYLGCPQGAPDAVSCTILFRAGRAASVTELHPAPPDDRPALETWQVQVARMEKDIGRAPAVTCPADGPDRVSGDCTATWSTARLVVAVGAHRNPGSRHRGAITVYTTWSYPPLARDAEAVPEASAP